MRNKTHDLTFNGSLILLVCSFIQGLSKWNWKISNSADFTFFKITIFAIPLIFGGLYLATNYGNKNNPDNKEISEGVKLTLITYIKISGIILLISLLILILFGISVF
ncbi:hypothetical protein AHMF7616_01781 [Adhaeribacter pallidiroseus]|uniref:Uncharacterized protein n=1 Tax=Adhaeribacter pallidiroseus TaxID=2072847 RepID=A0A369QFV8_9BACT|nr:hypothetical protein AHMF7616_01781 [Adhaeribacter pallidiroseus]